MSVLATIVVPPLITALLAAIGVWWKDWRTRRDLDRERDRAVQQARDEIATVEAWVKAYDLVISPDLRVQAHTRAQSDLEGVYARLSESLNFSRGAESRTTFVQRTKILLMVGNLHTRAGKVVRLFYYLSLFFAALWAMIGSSKAIGNQLTVENVTIAVIMILVGSLLIPLAVYHLVLRFDRWRVGRTLQLQPEPALPPSSR